MAKIDRVQLDWLQYAFVGALNFAATASSSDNVTASITTVLSTAGDNGVSVPLQVATVLSPGVVTTASENRVIIVDTTTKQPLTDPTGNEIYGRLTESGGIYTLSYFTLINGVETAYTLPSTANIDFYFTYQYDAYRYPRNSVTALNARIVQQDPSGSGGSSLKVEKLTVTGTNTLSALSSSPSSPTNILLLINGKTENPFGGASASFSVTGTAITWNAVNSGYSISTTFDVVAMYW